MTDNLDLNSNIHGLDDDINTPSSSALDFLIAEYSGLREEILTRTETQHQLILADLIAAGTFFTLSSQTELKILALIYPILASFLFLAWLEHDIRIQQIGIYINRHIESKFLSNNQGWEHQITSHPFTPIGSIIVFSFASGILIGTQIVSLVIYWSRVSFPGDNILLVWLALFSVFITALSLPIAGLYKIRLRNF